jgi:hypothetical protein
MTMGEHGSSLPGEARQVMDELEAALAAEIPGSTEPAGDPFQIDWAPTVPGCEEPPD